MSRSEPQPPAGVSRRRALKLLAGLGIGTAAFQRALALQVEGQEAVTAEMIRNAEWAAGLELTDEQREVTARSVNRTLAGFRSLHDVPLDNGVPPALTFYATPTELSMDAEASRTVEPLERTAGELPATEEDVAFLPVSELAALIRTRKISSTELTRIYLDRLRRYDKVLTCVVNLTEDLALRQAKQADREISLGRYRGVLHGIPWGAKDLIAYPPFKTTWGAPQFKDQVREVKATVASRLDDAGVVLVAKLSLGALAWGDDWFGGITKNPWNPEQGSSGSSAGSASATAAGLVGFSLGSETLGSIVSPCRRCGTTGLRPTFGRVSRHGCMALAWSMDKIGPITRSVQDAALVFAAIHGYDGLDPTAVTRSFPWPPRRSLSSLKVGYIAGDTPVDQREDLKVLRSLGVQLVEFQLPSDIPVGPVASILNVEAATVFDDLIRAGDMEGLNRWPAAWRQAKFVTAVDYLRANRVRTLLIQDMQQRMKQVDLYVGGNDLVLTNLTGHPTVVMPDGFRETDGVETPESITFTGQLFGESELLAVAHAYQQATGHHLRRPNMQRLEERVEG